MTDPSPVFTADNLRKSFSTPRGPVKAVDGISLELAPSDFVALHGPSGCGKSTLLLIAGALLSPDEGTIRIDDADPYALDANGRAAFRAANVGFVFQQFHLIPFLDVLDNVLAPQLSGREDRGALRTRALELLEKFNLSHRLNHVPSALSVGEQQRVALARALLKSPRLLLADEPTGNLDEENARVIMDHLSEFAKNRGAVLMVTHDPAARASAKRSLHLEAGRITA